MYNEHHRRNKKFFIAPLIIGVVFLFGWFVMLLWNAILPALLGTKTISYWQSLGLLVLCKILFGGLGFKGRSGNFSNRNLRHNMANMSEDERRKFREEWKKRFC